MLNDRAAILFALATYSNSSLPAGWATCRPDVPILMVVHEEHTIAIRQVN